MEAIHTENFRIYNSIEEMLETEKFNILYPAVLPNRYKITAVEVLDYGDYLEIAATGSEPYIAFVVLVNASNTVDSYSHEVNGVKYNISELGDGLYQAEFIHNDFHYTIAVKDKAVLSEIIENLRECTASS
jgi:hypothetical protein